MQSTNSTPNLLPNPQAERRYRVEVYQGDGTKSYTSLKNAPWNIAEERANSINRQSDGLMQFASIKAEGGE